MQDKPKHSPKLYNSIIVQNLDFIVNELGLTLTKQTNRYTGCCPVHGGDSTKAFTIYVDDARWFCWSRHCEENLGSNFINLICHLKNWSYSQTTKWLLSLEYDPNFVIEEYKPKEYEHTATRDEIRSELQIPAGFYLKKGFTHKILNEYDVGYCANPRHAMFGRVVFPVYDQVNKFVGYTGRTIYPISNTNPKWQHYQIKTSNYLYNLNKAYSHIEKSQSIILVESCGNVLRLVQNGILNVVGTFGAHLSRQQEIKIECSPAKKVYLMFDQDKAGQEATNKVIKKYGQKYEIVCPDLSFLHSDIGDATVDEINQIKALKELK